MGRLVAWHGVTKWRLVAAGGAVALAVTGVVPGALGAAAAAGTAPGAQGFTITRSSYGVPTKPSQQAFYQQNSGDEYWGTIFRSQLISQLAGASPSISVNYLEGIEHAIGTIDNGDNTRPAARYFIPYLVSAYNALVAAHDPIVSPATYPDLQPAIRALARWNGVTTLGSPAMSIFMNFLEAYEHNVFEGGLNPGEQYTGKINFGDGSLGLGTFGGLGGMATYNLLYHILHQTQGMLPCSTLCYQGDYFAGHGDQLLVESLNDAITILSGTGPQPGQAVNGFGTTDIAKWGYQPALDHDWAASTRSPSASPPTAAAAPPRTAARS